jgi:hypothetical protein
VALRPQKREACIFCGQGPLTAEHVLPKWLQEWGLDGSGQHTLVSGEEYKTYSAPPFSASRKVVCKKCNTGWMSRLEAVSKPLLKALILGETRLIETFAQPLLATWAYKTTLVQDAAVMAEQKLWPFFYEDLHLNRLPHAQAQVWTARYDWQSGDGDLLSSYRARMDRRKSPDTGERLDDGPRMFTGVFTLGCVLFVTCVGHDSAQPAVPIQADIDFGDAGSKLARIWPVSYSFSWPPSGQSFALAEFEKFREPRPREWTP